MVVAKYLGVHALIKNDEIEITAVIASLDGTTVLRDKIQGKAINSIALGAELGEKMLANGGAKILAEIL